ncbi:hypothetical protein BVI2075_560019 [Burkholderia vietnamiensis]|nr:hypothetical protein BVI2075_560019 [Burkholderia vietnamiensis]
MPGRRGDRRDARQEYLRQPARQRDRDRACMREVVRMHDLSRGDPRGLQRARAVRRGRGRPARQGLGPRADVASVVPGDRDGRFGSGGRDSEVLDQPRERKSLTRRHGSAYGRAGDEMDRFARNRNRAGRQASGRRSAADQLRRVAPMGDRARRLLGRPGTLRREDSRSDPGALDRRVRLRRRRLSVVKPSPAHAKRLVNPHEPFFVSVRRRG